ncbi:hypothetical protein M413DRAFT_268688 [Hebeloma cylindrosporum]|uniref:Uncharacterized protein n=1 Tax=Hebeloma cylindrosporum TaxID=76867 RepID=A0A0C3CSJ7_HEBCY|nr:hypothetical protein M413DRAFT_268688 [Hebeloma cylindrosporum h7]
MIHSYGNAPHGGYSPSVIAHSHQNELYERISRWRMGVQQASDPSCIPTSSVKTRRRLSKPYARAEPHLRRRISSSSDTFVDPPQQNLWTPPEVPTISMQEVERGPAEGRIVSPVTFRGLDQLPDPYQNPLITKHPCELVEEYNRIVFMCNTLEDMKQQAELRWLRQKSVSGMQDLMDIGAAIQRVYSAAQYIEDFSCSHGFDIDFRNMFSRNRYPPQSRHAMDLSRQDRYVRNSGPYRV